MLKRRRWEVWEEKDVVRGKGVVFKVQGNRGIGTLLTLEEANAVASAGRQAELGNLTQALKEVTECLINWMEIADTCDRREYDEKAVRKAKHLLSLYGVEVS